MPKVLLFWLMDALTGRTCHGPSGPDAALALLLCPSGRGQALADNLCTAAGGTCELTRDGFYVLSYCAIAVGILSTAVFGRVLPRLEALPLDAWRAKTRTE
jgi:MFS transporter, PAT family, solute carrier family 33 (acetyl-CoA transportor), member 1